MYHGCCSLVLMLLLLFDHHSLFALFLFANNKATKPKDKYEKAKAQEHGGKGRRQQYDLFGIFVLLFTKKVNLTLDQ